MLKTHFVKARKRGETGAWLFLDRTGRGVKSRKSARQFTLDEANTIVADASPQRPDIEFKTAPIASYCLAMVLWGQHPRYCNGSPFRIAGGSQSELRKQLREREAQGFTGLCILQEGEAYPMATETAEATP